MNIYINDAWLDDAVQASPGAGGGWTFSFKLFGLVDVSRTNSDQPPTRAEKVAALIEQLRKAKKLADGRLTLFEFRTGEDVPPFRLETSDAVKVTIPPESRDAIAAERMKELDPRGTIDELFGPDSFQVSPHSALNRDRALRNAERQAKESARKYADEIVAGFEGINLWYSPRPAAGPRSGPLFLLFGIPAKGTYSGYSAFSTFEGLVSELGGDAARTRLRPHLNDQTEPRPTPFQEEFRVDPLRVLADLDARIGSWQSVTTLYEVRANRLYRAADDAETLATFGYPIFIATATDAA